MKKTESKSQPKPQTRFTRPRKFDTSLSERKHNHASNLKVCKCLSSLLSFTIFRGPLPGGSYHWMLTTLTKDEAEELLAYLNRVIPTMKDT